MKRNFNMLTGAILIALIVPVVAQLPSDDVNTTREVVANHEAVEQLLNMSIINPMDPRYVWGNPLAIDLSGVDPVIFQSAAFKKEPGGLTSGDLYTTSINNFRNADPNAGASNASKKAAKIGLVHWP